MIHVEINLSFWQATGIGLVGLVLLAVFRR